MEKMFQDFNDVLEKEVQTREEIKKVTKELELTCRRAMAALTLVHGRNPDVPAICNQTRDCFPKITSHFSALNSILGNQQFKFRDMWKQYLSQVVFIAAFTTWLENYSLITLEDANKLFNCDNSGTGITIELEDYLLGLTSLPSELVWFCAVLLWKAISNFVNELYAGYKLLNLKNDTLRKRYDSMKYDVKKIEEVLYDISIRGLDKK